MNDDPKFLAGIDLLKRTGMTGCRIAHSAEEEGDPVIWHVTGTWGKATHECCAAMHPVEALMRLCEQVIDGGICSHCTKQTIFVHDTFEVGYLQKVGCVYAFDPELRTFRRGCE